jgi:uncharacterized 2Fe-2S/4Fe-4S cluster protein (DUF4445 family)
VDDDKNKECTVEFEPSGLKVKVASGTTLLEAAHGAGVYLSSVCGMDTVGNAKLSLTRASSAAGLPPF